MKKFLRRTFSILLAFAMLFGAVQFGGDALVSEAAAKQLFSIYTYTVENGEATITGVNDDISGDITIPSTMGGYPVTGIGEFAFSDCFDLTSVVIPDCVTEIGIYAFSDCNSIESIVLPKNLTEINEGVFEGLESLTSIEIPDSVTSFGNSAFSCCKSLTSIEIPDEATSIEEYTFAHCESLTSVEIPDEVTSIGDFAFCYCISLTDISIPDGVTSIGNGAFWHCESLTDISIPYGVESFGYDTFAYCESLTSFSIPSSVKSIGGDAFACCYDLESISIPSSVTSIDAAAFYMCNSLTDVHYDSNEDEWNEIYIDEESNEALLNATIHFCFWAQGKGDIVGVYVDDLTLNYKETKRLETIIGHEENAEYTVKYYSDSENVTVDEDTGMLYGAKRGTANIIVEATDSHGNIVGDICTVTVEYTWWQWLIKIVLFGWIWY